MSASPDIPPEKEESNNQASPHFLDTICPYAPFRIIPLTVSIIILFPKMLSCCQPYVGTSAAFFFFFIAFYCFFSELYSFYFFTFKKREFVQWIYTLILVPVEYVFYIVMADQVGLAFLENHWDFWNRFLWNKHLFF